MGGTNFEILSSFDLIITSIMQSGNESVSVHRNDHNGSSIDIRVI